MAKVTIQTEEGPRDYWRCITPSGYAVHLTRTPIPEGGSVYGRTLCGHVKKLKDETRKNPKLRYLDCLQCPAFSGQDHGLL